MDLLNIFEIIILSSLIGSLIVLMILIVKGIFRNKLNFTFHYYIWLILIIKLIIPFGPQTPLNISNLNKNLIVQSTTNKNPQITQINEPKKLTNSPSLCGLIKPRILIPSRIAANICDEEFKYIIMHELTHLKNKDIFINWAITLLSIIYWFNPILLYGFHKMRQDCEISCDGRVISHLCVGENLQYGNTIIKVLELGGKSNRLMGTTSMVLNSLEIKRRIIMISKYRKINIKGILLGAVIVIIIGGLGIAINTSSINSDKNIAKATTLKVVKPATTSKSTVLNLNKL